MADQEPVPPFSCPHSAVRSGVHEWVASTEHPNTDFCRWCGARRISLSPRPPYEYVETAINTMRKELADHMARIVALERAQPDTDRLVERCFDRVVASVAARTQTHTGQSVTVANGAGRWDCSCGRRSQVQDDGYMYVAPEDLPAGMTRDAHGDWKEHVWEKTGNRVWITVSNRRKRGNKPLPADIAARTVYAGRPGPFGSPFAMQHTMQTREQGRAQAIDNFKTWFVDSNTPTSRAARAAAATLPDDAILECWCVPLACHAQVIADYENRRRGFIK